MLESILQDLRFALRSLRHTPGVTLTVLVTLMLGIGANTILFSVVYEVLLRPLPYPDPGNLVWIGESGNSKRAGYDLVLTSDIADWRAQSRSLAGIAALDLGPETLTFHGESQRIWAVGASESLDRILGVPPAMGRGFLPEELTLGGPKAVLLSDNLFRKRFGGDPAIIGKSIALSGQFYSVAGVLPASFRLPLSASASESPSEIDVILSAPIDPAQSRASGALARIKPGVSFSTMRAELGTILETSKKERQPDRELRVLPLHERMVGKSRLMLMVLWGAVTFVLLVACVNVTNVLLAKSAARSHETAIRVALGARRIRLVRQFLAESLVLAIAGGLAGLLVASVGLRLIVQEGPLVIPRLRDATLGWNVLVFTAVVSVITGILFGIVPALRASYSRPEETLKLCAQTISISGWRRRLHDVLIVSEIALTLALMAGAGLMLKSIWLISSTSAQYAPERVLSMRLETSGKAMRFLDESISHIESVHNVWSAGAFVTLLTEAVVPREFLPFTSSNELMETTLVTPHYFQAAGVRMLAGREFTHQDAEGTPLTAIVNESYVRRYGGVALLGREIRSDAARTGGTKPVAIVGIVSDFRRRPDSDSVPQIYMALAQHFVTASTSVYVRTSDDPLEIAGTVRKIVTRDGAVSVSNIQTLEEEMSTQIAPRRFQTALLTSFAALSLLLALVGIYGVLSYTMGARTHEIGIRMALGGSRAQVVRMVLVGHGKLVFAGLGLGVLGTLSLNRVLSNLIYGVKPTDASTLAAVCLVLGTLALIASYLPARRAAAIDPVVTLRPE